MSKLIKLVSFLIFTPIILFGNSIYTSSIGVNDTIKIWLKSEKGIIINSGVEKWEDQSGNDFHISQTDISKRPIVLSDTLNGYPSIKFDGINDFLLFDSVTTPNAMIFVLKIDEIPSFSRIIDYLGINGINIRSTSFDIRFNNTRSYIGEPNNGYFLIGIKSSTDTTDAIAIFNNQKYILGSDRNFTSGNYTLGAYGSGTQSFNGQIFESIIFDSVPNDSIFNKYILDLDKKYSPSINLGGNINIAHGFSDTVIDAYQSWFTTYRWSTGSTDSAITVSSDGKYLITVTDIFGYESSDSVFVNYPKINYPTTGTDTTFCLNDTLWWDTGLSSGYTHEWYPIQVSTTNYPITKAGKYSVKITDSEGNFKLSDTITVSIDSFPVQNRLGADRDICKYESVTLTGQGENIASWLWNTGSTESFINIETAGEYSVTVTNTLGCKGVDTATYGISGVAPNVLFIADTVCFRDSTTFINLSTIESGYAIDSFLWEFGNDSISVIESPKHAYQTVDTFVVTLTAYAAGGCSSFYNDSIVIKKVPEAGFTIKYGTTQCTGTEVSFTDTSHSDIAITGYNWLFGNGDNSTGQNPIYTYNTGGNFTVQQKITVANGCPDSTTQMVTVSDELPLPKNVFLTAPKNNSYFSTNKAINFRWDKGENTISYLFEIAQDTLFTELHHSIYIDSPYYTYVIPESGKWYWRVSAFNLCGDSITTPYRTLKLIIPGANGELIAWYKSDEGITENNGVEKWEDITGNQSHLSQIYDDKRPVLLADTLNGYPSIKFDGLNDFMLMDSITEPKAFMFVFKIDELPLFSRLFESDGENGLNIRPSDFEMRFNNNSSKRTLFGEPSVGYIILAGTKSYDTIPAKAFINGIKYNLGINRSFDMNRYAIGAMNSGNHPFSGQLFEAFIFDTLPSDSLINEYTQASHYKYAPPINFKEDINITYGFADTTISAYKPWFTSYQWDTGSTDSAIAVSKSGTYAVTVTDVFGFESTDSIKVTYPQPKLIADTLICLYDTIIWDLALKGDYTYQWSNGEITPQISITKAGDYWVTISDNKNSSWYSDTISITINNFPAIVSLGNDTTLCQGNRIYLQNGYEQAISYIWSTGDTTDHIVLENAGTYSVTATNSMGCVGIDTTAFKINGIAPTPNFTFINQCLGSLTQFVDNSSSPDGSNITDWSWNFGDGSIDEGNETAEHKFETTGTYNVVLTVDNENSCSNSIHKDVQIFNTPVAQFGPQATCSNIAVELTDLSTSIDGNITDWEWKLPDGSTENTQNTDFTFTDNGSNEIQLVVQTDLGCFDTTIQIVDVKPGPVADFTFSAGCNGYPVYFTDASESFLNSELQYLWTFEQGNNSTQNNPDYIFPDTGSYSVLLEINQQINNCSNAIEKTVVIQQNPIAGFEKDIFCEKGVGKLTDISTPTASPINKWKWTIDTLGVFYGKSIELTFEYEGAYKTQLIIEDAHGCFDITTDTVMVYPLPKTYFLTNINKGPIPLVVEFDNQTTGAESYMWKFGDGNSSTETFPTHTYTDSGTFEIELLSVSQMGCSKSSFGFVRAIEPMIDIAVTEITTEINNGYMQVAAILQNRGTIDLENVELFYKANYGQTIKEVITETLHSGQTLLHVFATQMQVKSNIELTHVCVTALPFDYTDEIPDNNEKCLAFESAFKPMLPYPNPANSKLIIEYIIPFDAEVKIQLFNQYGKLTHKLFEGKSAAGFNRHVFDVRTLSKGVYIYRIEYEGTIKSYQLIVN